MASIVLCLQILVALCSIGTVVAHTSDIGWYTAEIDFLANLKSRLTGSPSQNKLIDRLQHELERLGLSVHTDTLRFTYLDQPLNSPKLTVEGQDIVVSSYAPYSGSTDLDGIGGKLIDLTGAEDPDDRWELAAGNIAVVNVTNSPLNLSSTLALWPGQPPWYVQTGVPSITADGKIANMTLAADSGVKGVVYLWDHISTGNAQGQYVPFKRLYQDCPTLHISGQAAQTVRAAAQRNASVNLTLSGKLVPETETRTIWVVVEGTTYKNESVIINTHTDGVNAVEENGHIALLAKARDLVLNPPQRTTILAFITGHMHQPAFSTTGRATKRWMDDHPEYWRGGVNELKAVASVCVEHLGAVDFVEDLATNNYRSSGNLSDEWIYANTPEIVSLTEKHWNGAYPGFVRINNPIPKGAQSGEGEPLTQYGIPNMSLITVPLYLLAEMPADFDERQLVDISALKRQVDSFLRIWADMDTMPIDSLGVVAPFKRAGAK